MKAERSAGAAGEILVLLQDQDITRLVVKFQASGYLFKVVESLTAWKLKVVYVISWGFNFLLIE